MKTSPLAKILILMLLVLGPGFARSRAGTVVTWGNDQFGLNIVPNEATNIIAIAAGDNHNLALRGDGRVIAWGDNSSGQCNVPADATNVVAAAGGNTYSMALRQDGTVLAWSTDDRFRVVPHNYTNIVAIAAGTDYPFALNENGEVLAWDGCIVPKSLTNIISISVNDKMCAASRSDGAILVWNSNQTEATTNSFSLTPQIALIPFEKAVIGFGPEQFLNNQGARLLTRSRYAFFRRANYLTNLISISARGSVGALCRADGTNILIKGSSVFDSPPAARGAIDIRIGISNFIALLPGESPTILRFAPYKRRFSAPAPVPISVLAVGGGKLKYNWFRNGQIIPDWTGPMAGFLDDTGYSTDDYSVIVSNEYGAAVAKSVAVENCSIHLSGRNYYGKASIPASLGNPIDVVAGGGHSAALNADGTVTCWGKNVSGQCNVPIHATNVVSLAAGGSHTVAVNRNRELIVWGGNESGQLNVPESASGAISISAGWAHCIALKPDGKVIGWGDNQYGQTDTDSVGTNVIAISSGHFHNLALKSDGTVLTWGDHIATPGYVSNVVGIAAGNSHSLALRADGRVVAWGDNSLGQCEVPETATNVVAIAAGFYRSIALRGDGVLVAWGRGFPETEDLSMIPPYISAISSGDEHWVALNTKNPPKISPSVDSVVAHQSGDVILTQRVVGTRPMKFQWTRDGIPVLGATNWFLRIPQVTAAEAGTYKLLAENMHGSSESEELELEVLPTPRITIETQYVSTLPNGNLSLNAQIEGKDVIALRWFRNGVALSDDAKIAGSGSTSLQLVSCELSTGGKYRLYASNQFGSAWSDEITVVVSPIVVWGDIGDSKGQPPPIDSSPLAISAGYDHSLALLESGRIVAWGDNSCGQCNVPLGLQSVTAIASGDMHNLAVLGDGSVVAWGDNAFGQSDVPEFRSKAIAVSAAGNMSLAATVDGEIVVWGDVGRFGKTPVTSTNLNYFEVASFVGSSSGLWAVTKTGQVYKWSGGEFGEWNLGLSNVVDLAVSRLGTIFFQADGTTPQFDGIRLIQGQTSLTNCAVAVGGGDRFVGLRFDGGVISTTDDPRFTVTVATNAIAIARGNSHGVAIVEANLNDRDGFYISQEPSIVQEGAPLKLFVRGSEDVDSGYRWFRNGVSIEGRYGGTFSFPKSDWEHHHGDYWAYKIKPRLVRSRNTATVDIRPNLVSLNGIRADSKPILAYGSAEISIRNPLGSGTIFYSLDGLDVTTNSSVYSGPFTVESSVRLKILVMGPKGEVVFGKVTDIQITPRLAEAALVLDTLGGGQVSADGEPPSTTGLVAKQYPGGVVASVSAHPDPGWNFIGWTGDADGTSPSIPVEMISNRKVRAVFGTTISPELVGDGRVEVQPRLELYPYGMRVRAYGFPTHGSYLLAWLLPEISAVNPFEIVVTNANPRLSAVFTTLPKDNFAVSIAVEGDGDVSVRPAKQYYAKGERIVLHPNPGAGQSFVGWEGDVVGTSPGELELEVDRNHRILARFTREPSLRIVDREMGSQSGAALVLEAKGLPEEVVEFQESADLTAWRTVATKTNLSGAIRLSSGIIDFDSSNFFRVRSTR